MSDTHLQTHRNVQVTANDDVPADVRRIIANRVEKTLRGAAAGDFVQVTIAKRRNPNEIYDVRVGTHGTEFQKDFERGDLDSELFDMWLTQKGEHFAENCWCGHPPKDHSLPQCTSCEI